MQANKPRVAIIGAGVSGLSAGCYLQASGFDTEVFEMAPGPGGVSVSWKRKGYTFDAATNWLPGSSPAISLHGVLAEVLDFSRMPIIEFDDFTRIELGDGTVFRVWKNVERLEQEMLALAPEDAVSIRRIASALREVTRFDLPVWKAPELYSPLDLVRVAAGDWRLLRFVLTWRGRTIDQCTARLHSARLRDCLRLIFPHHGFFSMLALLLPMGWMCMKTTGYPLGGSERFNSLLLEHYTRLGGRVRYNCRVRRIAVSGRRVTGVELPDGSVVGAGAVLSAAAGEETLCRLLHPSLVPARARQRFGRLAVYPAMLQVSLGVKRTFDIGSNKVIMRLRTPIPAGRDPGMDMMIARFCSFDPSLAPPGCTSVVVNLRTDDWQYWVDLRASDPERYRAEKQRVAQTVIGELDTRFGPLRDRIEVTDVATPATYVRYTSTYRGSYQGWAPAPSMVGRSLPKRVPGLKCFYMCGQWVEVGGGLPRAVLSARNAAQVVCRDFGLPFAPPAPHTL